MSQEPWRAGQQNQAQPSADGDDVVDVDTTEARDSDDFEALPGGSYKARVLKAEKGQSKKGNPKVAFTFEVIEGEHKGRWLTKHVPTVGEGSGILRSVVAAFGIDLGKEKTQLRLSSFIGQNCTLVVRQRSYVPEGETESVITNDVKKVLPATAAEVPLPSGVAGKV